MPDRKVFVYGSHAAAGLVNNYSEGVARTGYVVRQSLISAMNGPSGVSFELPPGLTGAAAHQVRQDALASLPAEVEEKTSNVDCILWDLADERFGVHALTDGTFITASPQLKNAELHGAAISNFVRFGTREHLVLWKAAADRFVDLITSLGLRSKTFVLQMPWASHDENGEGLELPFGLRSRAANAAFKPYYRHLRRRGIRVIKERKTTAASGHQLGPSPLNIRDSHFHSVSEQLASALDVTGTGANPQWNWDAHHRAPVLRWSDPEQLNVRRAGRTEHRIAPRKAIGEKFPARFLLQNTGSDTLLVVSHGALPRAKYKVPRFEFLSTLEARTENLLFLADGALESNAGLELAWFTGDSHDDLTQRFSSIVRLVSEQLGVKKILFIGGSGGGFASVNLAAATPGSRALVFNPQTAIRRYWAKSVSAYQKTLFPEMASPLQLDELGKRVSLVTRIAAERPTTYQIIYVQNDDDAFHVENHLKPFARVLGMGPETATSSDGNVQFVVERFASGHNMPYREVLNGFIDYALENWGDNLPREIRKPTLNDQGEKKTRHVH
ncbi:DUF6270 domain-containing protein [Arthrobacter sp. 7Tela_A1]|uniref:DUF6270 domain-containing protein n=1 Tax=Arthrobacter sp. 7Tela_A1 TaxID=3093745 RepID=UPI003BB54AE1